MMPVFSHSLKPNRLDNYHGFAYYPAQSMRTRPNTWLSRIASKASSAWSSGNDAPIMGLTFPSRTKPKERSISARVAYLVPIVDREGLEPAASHAISMAVVRRLWLQPLPVPFHLLLLLSQTLWPHYPT